jgi:site-specific DNA recombinase
MEHGMKTILSMRPKARKTTQERRVGFYLRVSTEEQAENPEGSIKNQEERLKLTLSLKNSDGKFGTLAGVYCDAGRSGKDMNRPELQRLLKAIASGEINMVMVVFLPTHSTMR